MEEVAKNLRANNFEDGIAEDRDRVKKIVLG
jgi:hypothetical protein